jgi:alpha-tubulin suppressor-like RCC1 family protein
MNTLGARPVFRIVGLVWLIVAMTAVLAVPPSTTVTADVAGATPGSPRGAAAVIAAGVDHSCALLEDGIVKCWGKNTNGQLGVGDKGARGDAAGEMGDNLPAVDLGTGRTATAIVAGSDHSCALLDDRTVKCWGDNFVGQLGVGDINDRGDAPGEMGDNLAAVNLGTGRTATAISAGNFHSCALLDNSTVKCWGFNNAGQLGLGDTTNRGDAPGEMGDNLSAVDLGAGRTATAINAHSFQSCVLLDNGTVKCWGRNAYGQLGVGDIDNRGDGPGEMGNNLPAVDLGTGRTATAVVAGSDHSCALLDDRTVKCWGGNLFGQLGVGDITDRGDGPGEMGNNLPAVDLGTGRTATAISAGLLHSCALLDNDIVKCWGSNVSGELGQGDIASRGDATGEMGNNLAAVNLGTGRTATAITAGNFYTCALLDNGTVKCWGYNSYGQLGQGDTTNRGDGAGEMGNNLPVVDLGTAGAAQAVAAGGYHTCGLLEGGAVKCWGDNGFGQLGLSDTNNRGDGPGEMRDNLPAVDLGSRRATAIAAGNAHSCALLDIGTVKCWGNNFYGQLGLGDTSDRGDTPGEMGNNLPTVNLGAGRTATAIATGSAHSCALLDNGTVKCWGYNSYGQLGQGDIVNRGDGVGKMGDDLPAVNLGAGRTATAIAAGDHHTCARLDNRTVKCWGRNTRGQLGQGDTNHRGDAKGEMGDLLPAVALASGRTAVTIAAGGAHSCALLDNRALKCWGGNGSGQLGQGDTNDRGDIVNEMGDNLPAVNLGTDRTATGVSAGGDHTCARLDNGTVKCWGGNADGQLGLGDTTNRGDGVGGKVDSLPAVGLGTGRTATAISAGEALSCAVLDTGTIKCWGANFYGQLGQGDTNDRGDAAGEMGDNLAVVRVADAKVVAVDAPPAPPTSAGATSGPLQAVLTWTAPIDNGGAPITGWQIEQSTNSGLSWVGASFVGAAPAGTTITGLTSGISHIFRIRAVNAAGVGVASSPSNPVVPTAPPPPPPPPPPAATTSFIPLTPARVLDTRAGAKVGNAAGTGTPLTLSLFGRGGLPAGGIGAVALNVTVVSGENPTIGGGYVTVYPCGTLPDASNLNFTTGQTIPNSVIAPVSATGTVCFYIYGTAHLLADVSGYFGT